MNKKDSIGNRMKVNYEDRYRIKLTRRIPVILRLDGKSFHTLTRKCEKPFDEKLYNLMIKTAIELCKQVQGSKCCYIQSDEISIILTDFDKILTESWFDYNLQKIVSISSGIASSFFSRNWEGNYGIFDSRAFNNPKEEVCNYFIWRQQDWIRNSIQMLSQSYYSQKQLHKKNTSNMHELLHEKGVNWVDLPPCWKNGTFGYISDNGKWKITSDIIFTKNRDFIDKYLNIGV